MSTTITDTLMTSDQTIHRSWWSPRIAVDGSGCYTTFTEFPSALVLSDGRTIPVASRTEARWTPYSAADGSGDWFVSWLPGRPLTRDQAITAMTLAEVVATRDVSADPWRLLVEGWAAELHLTGQQAVDLLTAVA